MQFFSIFSGLLAVVTACPFPEPTGDVQKRAAACNTKDNLAYKALSSQGAKGSIFCNDYLHLPTITKPAYAEKTTTYETVKATYYKACPHYAREAEAEPEDGDALGKRQLLGFAGDLISKGCECLSLHPRTVYKTYYHTTVTVTKTYGKTTVCSPTPYT